MNGKNTFGYFFCYYINMSVAVVTALGTTISESTIGAELLAVAPVAIWGSAMFAAVSAGKIFGNIWNKNRNEIPNIEKNIQAGQLKIQQLGVNYLEPAVLDININLNNYLAEAEKVDKIFNSNYKEAIQKMSELIKKLNTQTFDLYQMWITTLSLLYVAGNDNTFYTLNKGKIDNLIGAYVSNPLEVDSLIKAVQQLVSGWNAMTSELDNWDKNVNAVIINTVATPNRTNFPATLNGATVTILPNLDIDKLINGVMTGEILDTITGSVTTNKEFENEKEKKKKKKKRKKYKSKKKKKEPKKKLIKEISLKTPESLWIAKITFTFYRVQNRNSNDRGVMKFHLKKGGVISKVRVKRGTFSVIALWSAGSKLGVGYRYWSQFNKKAIVNRDKVLSWVIPLITPEDREIAIPLELQQKMVKYK